MKSRIGFLIDSIRNEVRHASGLLVPISGGSDSALCFGACARALPGKTLGVYVGDNLRCRNWFANLGTIRVIPEENCSANLTKKEALRWAQFLSIAIDENRWLVGSRNRSEDVFGNYSQASRISMYLPLAGLWKSEVLELCQEGGVPDEIMASSRQAAPDCGRPQELADIPIEHTDIFLKVKVGELPEKQLYSALSREQIFYLNEIYLRNQFKHTLPKRGLVLPENM